MMLTNPTENGRICFIRNTTLIFQMKNIDRLNNCAKRFGSEPIRKGKEITKEDTKSALRIMNDSNMKREDTKYTLKIYLDKINNDEIIIHPSFQRDFCWNLNQCSYLIETILLNMHIGEIVMTHDVNGTLNLEDDLENDFYEKPDELTDAQQRTTAMWLFKNDKYRLRNLTRLEMLNGCKYSTLPPHIKKKFDEYLLSFHIYNGISNKVKLDLYNRTNSGRPLTKMEKQVAAGDSDFISLIDEISNDPIVIQMFKRSSSYYNNNGKNRDSFIKKYVISTYMSDVKEKEDNIVVHFKQFFTGDIQKLKDDILKTFKMTNKYIGDIAFFPYHKTTLRGGSNVVNGFAFGVLRFFKENLKNDVCLVRCSDQLRNEAYFSAVNRYKNDFGNCGNRQKSVATPDMVIEEFTKVAKPFIEPRCFDKKLKEQKWAESKRHVCAVCNNEILTFDDAEADHIVPFVQGGHTTLDNLQLVHSVCNKSKGGETL